MTDSRDQMIQALKDIVVPLLRERGFTGTFPHFRRRKPERIDLFTFQFDRHGGGFIIEIARCEPDGFTTHWGKQIPPAKVTAWDLHPNQRARIQPNSGSGTDSWFRYDGADFTRTAESVVPFVERAERLFDDFDQVQRVDGAA